MMVKTNLLPGSKIVKARSASSANLSLTVGLCLLLGTMVALPVVLLRQVEAARRFNEETEVQIALLKRVDLEIGQVRAQYEKIRNKLDWFNKLRSQGLNPDVLMRELRVLIPGDAWLESLTLGSDRVALVTGYSLSYGSVSQFISQLKLSPLCAGVELVGVKSQGTASSDIVAFQLKLAVK